jgi:hypothetical protein
MCDRTSQGYRANGSRQTGGSSTAISASPTLGGSRTTWMPRRTSARARSCRNGPPSRDVGWTSSCVRYLWPSGRTPPRRFLPGSAKVNSAPRARLGGWRRRPLYCWTRLGAGMSSGTAPTSATQSPCSPSRGPRGGRRPGSRRAHRVVASPCTGCPSSPPSGSDLPCRKGVPTSYRRPGSTKRQCPPLVVALGA